jgi:hypothetical protein
MEHSQDTTSQSNRQRAISSAVPYPVENLDEALEAAERIVIEHGTGKPISKDDIAKTLKKGVNSLALFFSTLSQYGIFNLSHGIGYTPSDLYRKYRNPVHDGDEYKTKLQMFRNAPLYSKIVENLNNHTLPSDEKRFANLLKEPPYNVNENSAYRASKIFFENVRNLRLMDANNTFRFSLDGDTKKPIEEAKPIPVPSKKTEPIDELFTLPIPLPNRRIAYLRYPIEDLTKRDIRVIQKAIEFIASSIMDDEEEKKGGLFDDILEHAK